MFLVRRNVAMIYACFESKSESHRVNDNDFEKYGDANTCDENDDREPVLKMLCCLQKHYDVEL